MESDVSDGRDPADEVGRQHTGGPEGLAPVDPPEARPGVPMEAVPEEPADGAHWAVPERQPNADEHLHRPGLERPTPVVGSAQPPRGLSGRIRRQAYRIPEHYARQWALLLLADRVDVVEDRLGTALAGPLERAGLEDGARLARRNPLALVAGAVVGLAVVRKLL